VEFADVLNDELESIGLRRRRIRKLAPPSPRGSAPDIEGSGSQDAKVQDDDDPTPPEKRARLAALDRHLAGLALSGGGIRSATFALGVLQGLATLKILSRFDYLSTVSGGGYIGGWLAAWMKREGNPLTVEDQLASSRITQAKPDRDIIGKRRIVDEEPEPIHHLRSYSNYLTPRPGLLSVDTWTVLTIYVRNALINQLLLLPTAMFVMLLGLCIACFYALPGHSAELRTGVFIALGVLLGVAFFSMGWHVWRILGRKAGGAGASGPPHKNSGMLINIGTTIVGPMIIAAVLACWSFSPDPTPSTVGGPGLAVASPTSIRLPDLFRNVLEDNGYDRRRLAAIGPEGPELVGGRRRLDTMSALECALVFGGLTLLVHVVGYAFFLASGRDPDTIGRKAGEDRNRLLGACWMAIAAFMAGSTGGFLFFAMVSQVLWPLAAQPFGIVTIGPPLALIVVVAATFVEVWLLGRWQGDDLREWWARVCAWLVIAAAAWLAFFGITLYGPIAVDDLGRFPRLQVGTLMGWLATVLGGALAGRKAETKRASSPWWLRLLIGVAPTVFLAGLLVIVATAVHVLVIGGPVDPSVEPVVAPTLAISSPIVYWQDILNTPIGRIGQAMVVCAVLIGLAGVMSNVNLFSLNAMYASRLIRCYLGASRPKREWTVRGTAWQSGSGGAPTTAAGPDRSQNPLTGFDPDDDIPLCRMKIGQTPDNSRREPEYLGPHLVMNTSINLVAGGELAWQDRKAESFVLSPSYCGSKGTGYAPTTEQTARELTVGRAMSISGAAVDSNIGLHQSSALIALMTAINARLGWWLKNPNPSTWMPRWLRREGDPSDWDATSPSLALPLLMELLGQTNETRKWIHLSDGGHFENLGVYELVRRRCRYIVCTDAGTDPSASDDNLANMIRLCRIDFGVRIEIDTSTLAQQGPDDLSRWHCAVGKIRYDDVDGGELPGLFIYLRTSMTGDEPPDVQEYASKNPDFPWQSTLDQFFNESQFESYRALGLHVALTAFKDAVDSVNTAEPLWSNHDAEIEFKRGNQRLFSAIQRRWAPSPSDQERAATRSNTSWTELQESLGSEKDLVPLNLELYPELRASASASQEVTQLHTIVKMIQVMEHTWADLRMGDFIDLPMNRGWMSIFRRWTSSAALRRLWPILRGEYSQDFVKFCETQLELGVRIAPVERGRLDQDFFDHAKTIIGEEFAREWPSESSLEDRIRDAEQNWGTPTARQPISLLIQAPLGDGKAADSPDKVACGIVFASRLPDGDPARHEPPRYDLFVWVRRPYRGLGIASRSALKILTDFRDTLRDDHKAHPFTIQTRYPAGPTDHADDRKDEIEYQLWLNFFSHYDFRCPRGQKPIRDGYWVIERTFRPDEIEL
jgi:hypothetical protein